MGVRPAWRVGGGQLSLPHRHVSPDGAAGAFGVIAGALSPMPPLPKGGITLAAWEGTGIIGKILDKMARVPVPLEICLGSSGSISTARGRFLTGLYFISIKNNLKIIFAEDF